MNAKAQQMKTLLTKNQFHVDYIFNGFDLDTLFKFKQLCVTLLGQLKSDKMIIESVYVKALILDDINQTEKNKKVIQSAINLKRKKIATFCYN